MKILLVGSGAIGSCIAVLVKEAGYDIDVLELKAEFADIIRNKGIHLTGAKGEHTMKLNAYSSVDELPGKYDVCFIATKTFSMAPAAKSVLPVLTDDALVISMQNGICTEILAEVVGANRTVGCAIGYGATMHTFGEVEMTSSGDLYIGMLKGQSSPKLEEVRKMMSALLPTIIDKDIIARQYSKLIINSCINALAAICGEKLGVLLDDPRACKVFLGIAREGIYVAKAMGLKVPPFKKVLDYNLLTLTDAAWFDACATVLFRIIGKKGFGAVKPSTLQALERGEITEIDYFNGYIAANGAKYGVATPVNSLAVQLVKEIEKGERKMSLDNLDEFKL